jgi:flavin prenyltransferase
MANAGPVCVAMTGASGAVYGLRLIEVLLRAGVDVYSLISKAGLIVVNDETPLRLNGRPAAIRDALEAELGPTPGQLQVFGNEEWSAPIASGSGAPRAMVICPCTMGTLAAVAHGMSDNLIARAADVVLKERRTLIVVPRETPFSIIHLENMLRLARAGAVILPPNPGFYFKPERVAQMVDFVVARVLDQLDIAHTLMPRWGHVQGETLHETE